MGFHKYVETNVAWIYGNDESGIGWVGPSGGTGTVAISGGGIPVAKLASSNDFTTVPLLLPVFTKPSDSDPATILIGVPVLYGSVVGLRNMWVIYWQED